MPPTHPAPKPRPNPDLDCWIKVGGVNPRDLSAFARWSYSSPWAAVVWMVVAPGLGVLLALGLALALGVLWR